MFELGEYIGDGAYAAFFKIRGHPTLGVKVAKEISGEKAKKYLQEELKKAQILMQLNLPVPKYVEIIQVKVPKYFLKTLDRGIARNDPFSGLNGATNYGKIERRKLLEQLSEPIVYGLLMEYIERDLSLISRKRLDYIYEKEKAKIEQYGIILDDSDSSYNVLWSQSKAKLYFIDFDCWDLSKMHEPKEKASIMEKEHV